METMDTQKKSRSTAIRWVIGVIIALIGVTILPLPADIAETASLLIGIILILIGWDLISR